MGDGIFTDNSTIRLVGREGILLAAGATASIMQTSHPKIAQGVHEHSGFADDPVRRLRDTMEWMYAVVFGTRAEAERVSAVVHGLHEKVTGPDYRANDPELQVWVNATLLANALPLYERMFGRFSPAEMEAYYRDQKLVAEMLGCPVDAHPPTYADFLVYYQEMVDTLEISAESREVARKVLYPRMPWPARPVLGVFRLINIGLMPERLRRQYGWRWTRAHQVAFRAMLGAISLIYPRLPLRIRTVPRDVYLRSMRRRFGDRDPSRRRAGAAARPTG